MALNDGVMPWRVPSLREKPVSNTQFWPTPP